MAVQYIGVNRGAQLTGVVTDTSTTGKAVELAVDLTAGVTRKELLDILEMFEQFISDTRATPFAQ